MMQMDNPDDFVIGTGEVHSVRDFVSVAFSYVGLNWEDFVEISPVYYRPGEVNYLLADASKAREVLGWKPETSFSELVKKMVDSDLGGENGTL